MFVSFCLYLIVGRWLGVLDALITKSLSKVLEENSTSLAGKLKKKINDGICLWTVI